MFANVMLNHALNLFHGLFQHLMNKFPMGYRQGDRIIVFQKTPDI